MTRRRSTPSRRQVLAGISGIGALSAIGSADTAAHLSDTESVSATIQGGLVDVSADCEGCSAEDGRLELSFDALDPGDVGSKRVRLQVGDASTPVRLWLRTACPPVADPLGDTLQVSVSVERNCESGAGERLFPRDGEEGTVDGMRHALNGGVRLDDPENPCAGGGDTYCLVFDYRLPDNAAWAVGAETDIALELFAQQCRRVPEGQAPPSPFDAEDCPQLECPECVKLGKLDIDDDRLEPAAAYTFDELSVPFDADDHEYAIEVLTVTDKVDDERETVCASFRLLLDGSESDAPPMCAVTVAGSRPGGRSSLPDSRGVTYDIDPPLARTPGELCAAHDADAPDSEPDGQRPGISHVTVSVCAPSEVSTDESA